MKTYCIVPLLLVGLVSCTSERPASSTRSPSTAPQKATPAVSAPARPSVQYTVVSAYNKGGRTWRTILIKSPISDADLVALARYLHDLLRDESIRIVDDASQIKAYEDWDQNYPDAAYPFPEQWVRRHHIATINKMLAPGGAAWQLMGGSAHPTRPESKIADLE